MCRESGTAGRDPAGAQVPALLKPRSANRQEPRRLSWLQLLPCEKRLLLEYLNIAVHRDSVDKGGSRESVDTIISRVGIRKNVYNRERRYGIEKGPPGGGCGCCSGIGETERQHVI